ncbi:class II aldolase/adducin family protein [Amycolatopsis jejuensis]|uniref:class II aldolase/adducin family protein n=1 Tax=Amycolatopsis jejuensis TaxID=330084 RepID=UPI000525D802|nr:class II aldolase/adducin family protein [Amycolatopsis jejuensis]
MPDVWLETRRKIITFARKLQSERLVYSTAGNISMRMPGEPGLLAVTPTSTQYDFLEPEDITIVTLDGRIVDGRKEPTSEVAMHTLIHQRRPEVGAIVHTHGKAVMTMANLGWTLPPILTGLVEATGGAVRTSPYSQPETDQMADYTEDALRDRGATFLRFHGLLAVGADLEHAFHTASVVEGACEVYLTLRQLGEVHELPAPQVEWIASYWRAQFPGAPEPLPAPEPVPSA